MIRVFPRRTNWTPTDDLAFIGDPPLPIFRPVDPRMPVSVSCAFTWDIPEAKRLRHSWRRFYDRVELGGPAVDLSAGEFIPGRFLKPGVTITSRGCSRCCPWCFAWRREGAIRTLPIHPGHIVQDNNLLACPRRHIEAVFDMLAGERGIVFSGGLDASLFEEWHRDLLDTIRFSELWFACDTRQSEKDLLRCRSLLDGISIEKCRCYVLIGFGGETLQAAESRLEWVYDNDFLPFAQLYRGEQAIWYSPTWRALARKWSRPAAYRGPRTVTVPSE